MERRLPTRTNQMPQHSFEATSRLKSPDATTPDTAFRWTGDQWIFNINTKGLNSGSTYVYQIKLNDGSIIQFQYGLK